MQTGGASLRRSGGLPSKATVSHAGTAAHSSSAGAPGAASGAVPAAEMTFAQRAEEISLKNGPHRTMFLVKRTVVNTAALQEEKYTQLGTYAGDWHRDHRDGYGVQVYANGDKYEGEWRDDKPHGKGVFWKAVATGPAAPKASVGAAARKAAAPAKTMCKLYEGNHRDGLRHGRGRLYYMRCLASSLGLPSLLGTDPSAPVEAAGVEGGSPVEVIATYEGQFARGKPHGVGTLAVIPAGPDGSGGFSYDGEWLEGLPHGTGTLTMPNGDTYNGSWVGGRKHGPGAFTYLSRGVVYRGEWVEGAAKCGELAALPASLVRNAGKHPAAVAMDREATRGLPDEPIVTLPALGLAQPAGVLAAARSAARKGLLNGTLVATPDPATAAFGPRSPGSAGGGTRSGAASGAGGAAGGGRGKLAPPGVAGRSARASLVPGAGASGAASTSYGDFEEGSTAASTIGANGAAGAEGDGAARPASASGSAVTSASAGVAALAGAGGGAGTVVSAGYGTDLEASLDALELSADAGGDGTGSLLGTALDGSVGGAVDLAALGGGEGGEGGTGEGDALGAGGAAPDALAGAYDVDPALFDLSRPELLQLAAAFKCADRGGEGWIPADAVVLETHVLPYLGIQASGEDAAALLAELVAHEAVVRAAAGGGGGEGDAAAAEPTTVSFPSFVACMSRLRE